MPDIFWPDGFSENMKYFLTENEMIGYYFVRVRELKAEIIEIP